MAKEQNPDAYHGNGRISQAVGKGGVYSIIAGIAVGASVGLLMKEQPLKGVTFATTCLAMGAGFVGGGIDGWTKADRSIQDHDRLAHDAQEARTLIHQAVNQGMITPRNVSLEKS